MTLRCACGVLNRIPSTPKTRVRCGSCQHVFTPRELMRATLEAPPPKPELLGDDFELEPEDDD